MTFLSLDPSLTATGVIVADGAGHVLSSFCFRTEPSPKALKLAVGVDDADRMGRVLRDIDELLGTIAPDHVIAELPNGAMHGKPHPCLNPICAIKWHTPFSARGLETTGMSKLLVVALAWKYRVRPTWVRPGDVKRAMTGRRNASKDEIVAAAQKYGVAKSGAKPVKEAIADAFGVLVASGLWRPATPRLELSAT